MAEIKPQNTHYYLNKSNTGGSSVIQQVKEIPSGADAVDGGAAERCQKPSQKSCPWVWVEYAILSPLNSAGTRFQNAFNYLPGTFFPMKTHQPLQFRCCL